ncbi:MAG: molybdopterin-dependent oxidoreductase [Pseudomonadota bacterium]
MHYGLPPDACSLVVSSDTTGNITLGGNPEHPFTSGFSCAKIRDLPKRLKSPHRVVHPMVRVGGHWRTMTWDAALDLCADKIQAFRKEPASILHFHGEGAKGVLKQANKLFFALLGASRTKGSLCDATGFISYLMDFGSRKNNDISDLVNAKRIINWGKDLSRSSIHTAALVRKARKSGARVLTISPGGDGNGPFSDAFFRIRPGTDRFLAIAIIHLFIERNLVREDIPSHTQDWESFSKLIMEYPVERMAAASDVTMDDVEQVFRFYADEGPAASLVGAGLQRYCYGGENVRFINALVLVSGNIGRSGGGSYFHLHSLGNLNHDWAKGNGKIPRRALRMPVIGREILQSKDPPIKMIWINGSNMINQAPDSHQTILALESVPFKVVVDAFMTDTADRADLFLPSTLMLEQEDIVGSYLNNYIHYVKPVLKAPGEAKCDYWILSELGKGLEPPVFLPDMDTCFRASLDFPYLDVSLDELRKNRFAIAKRPQVAYEGMRFDHYDGKYRFPEGLHEEPPAPEGFPLRLLSLIRKEAMHSQILPEDQSIPPDLWLAPDCPALMHLNLEKDISLVSPLGRLNVRLHLLAGLHPGVALTRRGIWMKLGGGFNQLIAARLSDIGNGAPFYDQHVRLENS